MKQNDVKTFYIYCKIHCPRRSLDSTRLYRYLVANGLKPVSDPQKAAFIFVATCGGFALHEEFSLLTIEHALKVKSESAKLVVTGCLTKIRPDALKAYNDILVIHTADLDKLDSLIEAKVPYSTIAHSGTIEGVHDLYHGSFPQRIKRCIKSKDNFPKTLYFVFNKLLSANNTPNKKWYRLEISRGCLNNCSYCAIKLAMEKFHSLPESQILENFKEGLKKGYTDFLVFGGDIGCYGVDIGTNLPMLLKKLFEINGRYQIRLADLNPHWFVKYYPELLSIFKANREKLEGVVIPLQSGSDRVLKLMKRNYKINEVKRCLLNLRRTFPDLYIETHVMVGFPGETDADFKKSLSVITQIQFSKVEIYKYEDRPGTAASYLPNKVTQAVINARVRILKSFVKSHVYT
ncbi:MAG: radical SAM protein [Candidatus Bathyarchaeia archaeon]